MNDEEKQAWRKHAKEMENMRNTRRFQFRQVIREFEAMGFEVKEVSQYQYRFNDCIDIFPSNRRYHDLKTHKRGDIRDKNFNQFLREYFGLTTH